MHRRRPVRHDEVDHLAGGHLIERFVESIVARARRSRRQAHLRLRGSRGTARRDGRAPRRARAGAWSGSRAQANGAVTRHGVDAVSDRCPSFASSRRASVGTSPLSRMSARLEARSARGRKDAGEIGSSKSMCTRPYFDRKIFPSEPRSAKIVSFVFVRPRSSFR